jgi:hypothetical protein
LLSPLDATSHFFLGFGRWLCIILFKKSDLD